MWRSISGVNATVILTTHSMEECEALCERLTIMVSGTLRCLGSAQRLKDRYGRGYRVHLRLSHPGPADPDFDAALSSADLSSEEPGSGRNLGKVLTFLSSHAPPSSASKVRPLSDDHATTGTPEGAALHASASSLDGGASREEIKAFVSLEKRAHRCIESLLSSYPTARIVTRSDLSLVLEVSRSDVQGRGGVGGLFEAASGMGNDVEDFTVAQTSLEDVFRGFSRENEW